MTAMMNLGVVKKQKSGRDLRAMTGVVSDCLAGLGLPGCLGLCEKLGLAVHGTTSEFWS